METRLTTASPTLEKRRVVLIVSAKGERASEPVVQYLALAIISVVAIRMRVVEIPPVARWRRVAVLIRTPFVSHGGDPPGDADLRA